MTKQSFNLVASYLRIIFRFLAQLFIVRSSTIFLISISPARLKHKIFFNRVVTEKQFSVPILTSCTFVGNGEFT